MFARIIDEKPEVMDKIVAVFGDIQQDNLGLSDDHLKKVIEESELVFHMAASLKLEGTLKHNIQMNLLGTKNVIGMCKKMQKLILMTHLSTAFCTSDKTGILYEQVYDWKDDPNNLIDCASWMTENTMENMQSNLSEPHPNTYTYTKRLAEILVQSHFGEIPVCIVRPSIGACTTCVIFLNYLSGYDIEAWRLTIFYLNLLSNMINCSFTLHF